MEDSKFTTRLSRDQMDIKHDPPDLPPSQTVMGERVNSGVFANLGCCMDIKTPKWWHALSREKRTPELGIEKRWGGGGCVKSKEWTRWIFNLWLLLVGRAGFCFMRTGIQESNRYGDQTRQLRFFMMEQNKT